MKLFNRPNAISLARALLGLWMIRLVGQRRYKAAFAALTAGQFSDPLDGFIARRNGISNQAGEILDLFGDSTLTFGSFWGLVRAGEVPMGAVIALGLLAIAGQFVVQPRTRLPVMVTGSIAYYVFATAWYGRKAGLSVKVLTSYALIFMTYFWVIDRRRLQAFWPAN